MLGLPHKMLLWWMLSTASSRLLPAAPGTGGCLTCGPSRRHRMALGLARTVCLAEKCRGTLRSVCSASGVNSTPCWASRARLVMCLPTLDLISGYWVGGKHSFRHPALFHLWPHSEDAPKIFCGCFRRREPLGSTASFPGSSFYGFV